MSNKKWKVRGKKIVRRSHTDDLKSRGIDWMNVLWDEIGESNQHQAAKRWLRHQIQQGLEDYYELYG